MATQFEKEQPEIPGTDHMETVADVEGPSSGGGKTAGEVKGDVKNAASKVGDAASKAGDAVTNGETPEGAASTSSLQRVAEYPVVKDSLSTAYNLVQSNSISSAVYGKVEALSSGIYTRIEPVVSKNLPLSTVDGYAQSALDAIESRVPIKDDTNKLVERVRKPADDAVGIARSYAGGIQSRISPVTDQFTQRVTQGQEAIHSLQERVSSAVASVPKDKQSAQEALQSLVHEVESLSSYVTANVKELPANAQNATKPLVDNIGEALKQIRSEMSKTDTPLTQRASNILKYSREQVTPLLNNLKEVLLKKKKEAEDKTGVDTNGAIDEAKKQVNGVADEASKKADAAGKKVGEVKDAAADKTEEAKKVASDKTEEAKKVASDKTDEAKDVASDKTKEAKKKAPKVNGKA